MYFDVSKFNWPSWESAHFSWLTWGPNWPSYVVKQTNTHTLHHNIDITNTWRKHSTSNYLFYFPGKLFIYRETAYHGCWKRRGQWWRDSRTTNPKIRRSPAGRQATLASTIEPRFYTRLRPPHPWPCFNIIFSGKSLRQNVLLSFIHRNVLCDEECMNCQIQTLESELQLYFAH